jgi:hypothetical protein
MEEQDHDEQRDGAIDTITYGGYSEYDPILVVKNPKKCRICQPDAHMIYTKHGTTLAEQQSLPHIYDDCKRGTRHHETPAIRPRVVLCSNSHSRSQSIVRQRESDKPTKLPSSSESDIHIVSGADAGAATRAPSIVVPSQTRRSSVVVMGVQPMQPPVYTQTQSGGSHISLPAHLEVPQSKPEMPLARSHAPPIVTMNPSVCRMCLDLCTEIERGQHIHASLRHYLFALSHPFVQRLDQQLHTHAPLLARWKSKRKRDPQLVFGPLQLSSSSPAECISLDAQPAAPSRVGWTAVPISALQMLLDQLHVLREFTSEIPAILMYADDAAVEHVQRVKGAEAELGRRFAKRHSNLKQLEHHVNTLWKQTRGAVSHLQSIPNMLREQTKDIPVQSHRPLDQLFADDLPSGDMESTVNPDKHLHNTIAELKHKSTKQKESYLNHIQALQTRHESLQQKLQVQHSAELADVERKNRELTTRINQLESLHAASSVSDSFQAQSSAETAASVMQLRTSVHSLMLQLSRVFERTEVGSKLHALPSSKQRARRDETPSVPKLVENIDDTVQRMHEAVQQLPTLSTAALRKSVVEREDTPSEATQERVRLHDRLEQLKSQLSETRKQLDAKDTEHKKLLHDANRTLQAALKQSKAKDSRIRKLESRLHQARIDANRSSAEAQAASASSSSSSSTASLLSSSHAHKNTSFALLDRFHTLAHKLRSVYKKMSDRTKRLVIADDLRGFLHDVDLHTSQIISVPEQVRRHEQHRSHNATEIEDRRFAAFADELQADLDQANSILADTVGDLSSPDTSGTGRDGFGEVTSYVDISLPELSQSVGRSHITRQAAPIPPRDRSRDVLTSGYDELAGLSGMTLDAADLQALLVSREHSRRYRNNRTAAPGATSQSSYSQVQQHSELFSSLLSPISSPKLSPNQTADHNFSTSFHVPQLPLQSVPVQSPSDMSRSHSSASDLLL